MDPAASDAVPYRIAVVGSGPRGLSVLERLAARLAADRPDRPVDLHLIDEVQVGCGRVWRSDQPEHFLMNTVAGEVSSFSGPPDGGPARPGAGPSLAQWWSTVDPGCPGANGYAPRALHGRYMLFVLDAVKAALPPNVTLHEVRASVTDVEPFDGGYRLEFADGTPLFADRVILVTGHARPELHGLHKELAEFAATRPALRYIRGDSAADMPLEAIPAGSAVGVLGLGLSFYDVMAGLTLGRGGRFTDDGAGGLTYLPSGNEPFLVAGSRSGMPLPARGRNQKHADFTYTPLLFTTDRVRGERPHGTLDFRADVLPWLLAEARLVYYATALRRRSCTEAAAAFTDEAVRAAADGPPPVAAIAARHGAGDLPPLDLDALARPFEGRSYPGPEAFEKELLQAIDDDLAHAEQGNADSPLKAALDVLRDTRALVRSLVDFAGLQPASHRDDFIGWYGARSSFLAAGPPRLRLRQTAALIECGLLRIAGPHTRFAGDPATDAFLVSSPFVAGSAVPVTTVIDARIPSPDLRHDPAPLTRRLVERGLWTDYVNGEGPDAFRTGGVAVTDSPYHPVGRDGLPDTGLYVLGIPTEHTRWFMQGGSSRPGFWTDFVRDADAIAGHALGGITARRPALG
ncbi:FAD/NAD(P)-binding protein [Streptomyces sp. SCA3-4]|uniref:FAD/NAD(P)-binding protein n=1 Tax=Streptomyces sichuanensis TaxID=2871810 RepID=UPI001CE3451C|nr:FAD/NAD(P)-binding protein [Streptomyces sichuanensis]MCA6093731.1 FAD/NAD(P)-binding protein [Streptomyces sichuanensis]